MVLGGPVLPQGCQGLAEWTGWGKLTQPGAGLNRGLTGAAAGGMGAVGRGQRGMCAARLES